MTDDLHRESGDPELLKPKLSPAASSYLDGTGGAHWIDGEDSASPVGVLQLEAGKIQWTERPETERVERIVDIASRYGMSRADLYILLACGVRYRIPEGGASG